MSISMLYVPQLHHATSALSFLERNFVRIYPFSYMRAKWSSQLLSVYVIAQIIFDEKLKS
jgi:hypothetical protein